MRRKATCLAGIAAVALASLAQQPGTPPKGFRDYAWGQAPSKDLKKVAGPSDGVIMFVPPASNKPAPLFGVPVSEEAYSFSSNRFYLGQAWLDGKANFDKMTVELTKRYGPPSFSSPRIALWKWTWPNSRIEVHLYYEKKFARTTVTFLNNKY